MKDESTSTWFPAFSLSGVLRLIPFCSCLSGTWASLKRSIPQHSEDLTRSMDTGQERLITGLIDHLKTIGDWILEITWRYVAVFRLTSQILEIKKEK